MIEGVCKKLNIGLRYEENLKRLYVYSSDGEGYEKIVYLYDILLKSYAMNTINFYKLHEANFNEINISINSQHGIISGEVADFLTTNQNIVYTDEFITGLKTYMLSPALSEAKMQTRFAFCVFILTFVTTISELIIRLLQ